jgi:tRNA-binding EMAP/Myf-like protein
MFNVPPGARVVIDDAVRGTVSWDAEAIRGRDERRRHCRGYARRGGRGVVPPGVQVDDQVDGERDEREREEPISSRQVGVDWRDEWSGCHEAAVAPGHGRARGIGRRRSADHRARHTRWSDHEGLVPRGVREAMFATTASTSASTDDPMDSYDGPPITALDIRVGRITKVWSHEESEKLEIDVGEGESRLIASGLRSY